MKIMNIKIRILLILSSITFVSSQTPEELKKFMETYGKIKVEQQANDIVKKGIESESGTGEGPVRLLVKPGDISKYYQTKMKIIQKDLYELNRMLNSTDSIPPLDNFGYSYFSLRDSIQFIDNANVSSDYILGYGDQIIISIWGQAEQHERKTLDRDGTVFIENVGLLYLAGKTQAKAKSYILDRFSKVYATLNSNPKLTFLEFSIGKINNINVTVSGNVQFPGNYVVNPSISISNILVLAGGIKSTGTLRNILLQRGDTFIDSLDIYPLITGIGLVKQIPLTEGDIIVVPPRGESVAVTGNVLNPAYFEILSGENISTVLNYAAISKSKIVNQAIIARSSSPNLFVDKLNFNKTVLMDGDSLIVPMFYDPIKSISVSVSDRPLVNIPWVEDINFLQILNIVNVNLGNLKGVELIRRNKNNQQTTYPFKTNDNIKFAFLPSDHLSIHLQETFKPTKVVVVKGEIASPGTYPLINNRESLKSVINRAGGFPESINMNNVMVKRDTLRFGSSTGDLMLTPGDTIIISPLLGTVTVEGEVHNPGNFEWSANYSAKKYISFAGGLTTYGDKKHIIYISPYGEAIKISSRSNESVLPGSKIRISEKPPSEQNVKPDRFQQISSIVTSLVSIAILANTAK